MGERDLPLKVSDLGLQGLLVDGGAHRRVRQYLGTVTGHQRHINKVFITHIQRQVAQRVFRWLEITAIVSNLGEFDHEAGLGSRRVGFIIKDLWPIQTIVDAAASATVG